jgi:hypothetical protein
VRDWYNQTRKMKESHSTNMQTKKLFPLVAVEGLILALMPFLVFVNYNYDDFYISPALVTGIILYTICGFGIAITRRVNRRRTPLFVKGYFFLLSVDLVVIGITAIRTKKLTIINAAFFNTQAVYVGAAHVALSAIIIAVLAWVTFFKKV